MAHENRYIVIFYGHYSCFIMKMYVECLRTASSLFYRKKKKKKNCIYYKAVYVKWVQMCDKVRGEAFLNFITYTDKWSVINTKFVWKHFCSKEYWSFTWFRLYKNYYHESNCLNTFKNNIDHFSGIRYNMDVMRQSSCLVFCPDMIDSYVSSLIARRWVGSMTVPT